MNSSEGARRKLRYVEWFVLFRITGPGGGVVLSMWYLAVIEELNHINYANIVSSTITSCH